VDYGFSMTNKNKMDQRLFTFCLRIREIAMKAIAFTQHGLPIRNNALLDVGPTQTSLWFAGGRQSDFSGTVDTKSAPTLLPEQSGRWDASGLCVKQQRCPPVQSRDNVLCQLHRPSGQLTNSTSSTASSGTSPNLDNATPPPVTSITAWGCCLTVWG
jgi:hypothetical protein